MPNIPPPLQTVPTFLPATGLLLLGSTNETSHLKWRSNPDYRGTLNILFSCLTTLGLCAWTVLHLDIPTRHEGRFTRFTRKLGWFCVALFAPRILLVIAFNQRYLARLVMQKTQEDTVQFPEPPPTNWQRLFRNLRRLLLEYSPLGSSFSRRTRNQDQHSPSEAGSNYSDSESDKRHLLSSTRSTASGDVSDESPGSSVNGTGLEEQQRPKVSTSHHARIFTPHEMVQLTNVDYRLLESMQHAFYACMGGYAFDFGGPDEPSFLPCGDKRITVTPTGIALLLERYPDLIPDISAESIDDRSKSDALAKAIVIVQVVWFCVNFAVRLASTLPVSLLEVATIAHAISALVIYILWWDKPHDIAHPTLITGPRAREVCALMSMLSPTCRPVLAGLWTFTSRSEWAKALEFNGNRKYHDTSPVMLPGSDSQATTVSPREGVFAFSIRINSCSTLYMPSEWKIFRKLADLRFYLLFGPQSSGRRPWYVHPWLSQDDNTFTLSRVDLRRWLLASNALASAPAGTDPGPYKEALLTRHSSPACFLKHLPGLDLTISYVWSVPTGLLERMVEEYRYSITVAASLALYGAPHLLGWNARYPVLVERLLWQASVVTLLSPITMVLFLRFIAVLPDNFPEISFLGVYLEDIFVHFLAYTFFALGALLLLLYPAASAYLVVESFRQLFFLPDPAFNIPSWSEIWPHVS